MSKTTLSKRQWLTFAEEEELSKGISPVEFLISTFRDGTLALDIRMEAAKSLLPYVNKRAPQAVEITGAEGGPLDFRETSAIKSKLASMLGVST